MFDDLSRRIAAGPAQFPHAIDLVRDKLLLVELTESELMDASFLDQRIMTPATKGTWWPVQEVISRIDRGARDDAHYIFHIGHVGSTLISRLLGRHPAALALREPILLRSMNEIIAKRGAVDAPWEPKIQLDRIDALRRLLARTFRPDQRAIIKATSFTSECAPALIAPDARALFLFVSLESYMRTILAGENSRSELAALTAPRLLRLARRIDPMPFRLWSLGEGERAALGWATEMLSLTAAAETMAPGTVLWLDFDRFLQDPASALAKIARHFSLPLSADQVARLASDPMMQRYSKAPQHGYSADLRRQLQLQAAREHGQSLMRGRAWFDALAQTQPAIARLLAER